MITHGNLVVPLLVYIATILSFILIAMAINHYD